MFIHDIQVSIKMTFKYILVHHKCLSVSVTIFKRQ